MASSAAGAGGTPEEAPELTATEREWASWPMPSWAGSGLPNQPHYSPLDDGTVRDDVTGLVWSTTRIAPTAWSFALEACAAGFRLPTIIELISIGNPETSRFDDAFELRAQSLWSASPVFGDATSAWLFYGGEGSTYPWQASQRYPAICVRPGTPSRLPHYEQTRIGSVAAVRDNWTGLVWQQGTSPRTYQFAEGQSYCATVAVGFRTPSIKELQTLIDRGRPAPTIDPAFFPDTPIARFWSSTTRGEGGSTAYLVELEHGSANTYSVDLPGYMRCVR